MTNETHRPMAAAAQALARLPALARFLIALAAIHFAAYAALRLCFWAAFHQASAGAARADVLKALYLGLKFDLRLALLLALPLALAGWIPPLNPMRHRLARAAWIGYFGVAQGIVFLLYLVDFGHYAYLHVRLNASLIEHLAPVAVAAQMAWETYPVVPVLLGVGLLGVGHAWLLRGTARRTLLGGGAPLARWPRRASLGALAVLYFLGVWGAWSLYPLRWSIAYFSANEAVAALALNPVLYLADTLPNRNRPYDIAKVRQHYPYVASLLGIREPRARDLDFARYVAPPSAPGMPLNLVVIHMESLAGFQLGIFGNRLDGSPHFDAIARKGVLFTNFFVPTGPTARSVFTMLTGIPDFNPRRTASRNPLLVSQHTLVNALHGYDKYYFLGGSATWGNIRGLLANNVPDLRMFEEGDYDAPYDDTWGVSDLVLFEKAHQTFASSSGPFFAFLQTSGNHRPYTIPQDRRGFEPVPKDGAALRANGFASVEAYNGLRLLDYALGTFFAQAQRSPYFERTVFVLYGDHGSVSPTPSPWETLALTGHHVPLVIYAPWMFKEGRRIESTGSLPDVLPTSLGLLGVPYLNTGIGRDLLALGPQGQHFSMIGETGVLDDEFLLRVQPESVHLYRYRSEEAALDVRDKYPERVAALRRLHEALYETVKYLPYRNAARAHTLENLKTTK